MIVETLISCGPANRVQRNIQDQLERSFNSLNYMDYSFDGIIRSVSYIPPLPVIKLSLNQKHTLDRKRTCITSTILYYFYFLEYGYYKWDMMFTGNLNY